MRSLMGTLIMLDDSPVFMASLKPIGGVRHGAN